MHPSLIRQAPWGQGFRPPAALQNLEKSGAWILHGFFPFHPQVYAWIFPPDKWPTKYRCLEGVKNSFRGVKNSCETHSKIHAKIHSKFIPKFIPRGEKFIPGWGSFITCPFLERKIIDLQLAPLVSKNVTDHRMGIQSNSLGFSFNAHKVKFTVSSNSGGLLICWGPNHLKYRACNHW